MKNENLQDCDITVEPTAVKATSEEAVNQTNKILSMIVAIAVIIASIAGPMSIQARLGDKVDRNEKSNDRQDAQFAAMRAELQEFTSAIQKDSGKNQLELMNAINSLNTKVSVSSVQIEAYRREIDRLAYETGRTRDDLDGWTPRDEK